MSASWRLPSRALTAYGLAGVGVCAAALVGVVIWRTIEKRRPRPIRSDASPAEDARVAAAMLADKLAIAERLGAAIRCETISWDREDATEAAHSSCGNPLHGHGGAAAPPQPQPAPAAVAASRAALLRLHEHLTASYPRMHSGGSGGGGGGVERHVVGGYSLLYVWRGSDSTLAATGLYAHLDVVPAGEPHLWTFPPFSGEVKDGYIHGRGAIDDKHSVIGICEAIEFLLREGWQPRRTLVVLFGHDEEIGGHDGARLLFGPEGIGAHLPPLPPGPDGAARRPLAFLLDEGPMVVSGGVAGLRPGTRTALIGTAEKGYVTVEVSAQVTGGHASQPPRSTAIGLVSGAVARLEASPFPARLPAGGAVARMLEALVPAVASPLRAAALANLWLTRGALAWALGGSASPLSFMLRTTTAPTVFRAGGKENTLPGAAAALVNHRILPGDSVAGVLARDTAVVADPRVALRLRRGVEAAVEPSPTSSDATPAFAILAEAAEGLFPGALAVPALMIGATDSKWAWGAADAIYRHCPTELHVSELRMLHGADERIGVDNLARLAAFYARVVARSDAAEL